MSVQWLYEYSLTHFKHFSGHVLNSQVVLQDQDWKKN